MSEYLLSNKTIARRLGEYAKSADLPFRFLGTGKGELVYTGSGDVREDILELHDYVTLKHPKVAEQLPPLEEICQDYGFREWSTDNFLINGLANKKRLQNVNGSWKLTEKGFKSLKSNGDIGLASGIGYSIPVSMGKYLKRELKAAGISTKKPSNKLKALLGAAVMVGAAAFGAALAKDVDAEDSHKDAGRAGSEPVKIGDTTATSAFNLILTENYLSWLPSNAPKYSYLTNLNTLEKETLNFFPDDINGQNIVYDDSEQPSGFGDAVLYNIITKEQKGPFTEDAMIMKFAIFENTIAYVKYDELHLLDINSLKEKIIPINYIQHVVFPFFAENGKSVVYKTDDCINKINIDSENEQTILADNSADLIYANGNSIVFTNNTGSYLYDFITKEIKELSKQCVFNKDKAAFIQNNVVWFCDLEYLIKDGQEPPIQPPQSDLENVKKFSPTIMHDSRKDSDKVQLYTPYDPHADDLDIKNNHENFDAGKFPKENVVFFDVKKGQGFTYYTYIYERAMNPHCAGRAQPFSHEHDVNIAIVKVNDNTQKPVALACRQHFWWNIYSVSDVSELKLYSEWGSHELAKEKWELIEANGLGLSLSSSNSRFISLENRISNNDITANGYLLTDEPHPLSAEGIKAPWLLDEIKDPEKNVFQKLELNDWKKGWAMFELDSPADISVELDGKITSKDRMQIPNSGYENKEIVILGVDTSNNPKIKLVGTGNGDIHLKGILSAEKLYEFNIAAPISKNKVYEIYPDWNAISKNQIDALTIKIDDNGDGKIDKIIKTGANVMPADLNASVESVHPLMDTWYLPAAVVAVGFGLTGAGIYLGRRYFRGNVKPERTIKSHQKQHTVKRHKKSKGRLKEDKLMEELFEDL